MAEAFGTAVDVVQLAGVVLHTSKGLWDFFSAIRKASNDVRHMQTELDGLSSLIECITRLNEEVESVTGSPIFRTVLLL